jgi:hypothetical protein
MHVLLVLLKLQTSVRASKAGEQSLEFNPVQQKPNLSMMKCQYFTSYSEQITLFKHGLNPAKRFSLVNLFFFRFRNINNSSKLQFLKKVNKQMRPYKPNGWAKTIPDRPILNFLIRIQKPSNYGFFHTFSV